MTLPPPRGRLVPGDFLLSFTFIAALAGLVVNDFVLKGRAPGLITGRLSDFFGPLVLSLLGVALVECATHWQRPLIWATPAWFAWAGGMVLVLFALVKGTDVGAKAYVDLSQVIFDGTASALALMGVTFRPGPAGIVQDFGDVVAAMVAMPLALLVGFRWRGQRRVRDAVAPTESPP